jgi:hypothetical protein
VPGAPQNEELPQLPESVAEPLPVALGHVDHRRGHRDELVGLELRERSGPGLAYARRREEDRRGNAENRGEPREDGGARLLDAARLELRDRRPRDADAAGELGLGEMQPLAGGPDRECEGRPRGDFRDDRTLARCQHASGI